MPNQDVSDSFFNNTTGDGSRYPNPFYGIPHQYLPQNMDGMLWWAEHFLYRFGFYRTALQRIANYFITDLTIECDDETTEKQYKEIFETMNWKALLQETGLNLLAYGNSFVSINRGFSRFLVCPKCKKISKLERIHNFKFEKGKYFYTCPVPSCRYKGNHGVVDKPDKDVKKLQCVTWNPREIKMKYEDTTKEACYYWDIPEAYKKKVTNSKDKFFAKKTPQYIFDAIEEDCMVEFNSKNFLHLKVSTPASLKTDGKAVPLCIYMFDDFFMLKVLERFNEVICYEDINPFRVIAMADGTQMNNPVFMAQDGGVWGAAVESLIKSHRQDPGAYHKFPFPINFQHLGGQGKELAPVEMIQLAKNNILNALNIPQELYQMTLTTQAVGPALRMFENSWNCMVDSYNTQLQMIADVIANIKGFPKAKINLMPITFADDMERKSVIGQLVSSNSIARSEFLNLYKLDFKDQLRKKMQEDIDAQELQEEEHERQQLRATSKASIFGQQQQGGAGGAPASPADSIPADGNMAPGDILELAKQIAQQLHPMEGSERRTELQKIKSKNETLWHATKGELDKLTQGAKSEGLQQSKQQAQQG